MERDFRLNWPALVEEARRRRKAQRLTQQRLAAIADISTPTVSRFESGERNIQLASALAILEALGMTERSPIHFPDKTEVFDSARDVVLFPARTAGGEVTCAVSGEALEDHFGARGTSQRARLAAFRSQRSRIEEAARRKLVARQLEADGSILIRTAEA
jgi:transcriptional regulator with XRE-family HTH domain